MEIMICPETPRHAGPNKNRTQIYADERGFFFKN